MKLDSFGVMVEDMGESVIDKNGLEEVALCDRR